MPWKSHHGLCYLHDCMVDTHEAGVGGRQAHAGGKPSGLDKQEEVTSTAAGGKDVPAWHYNADGELTAALQAFADLRIIGEPHAPPAGSAAGAQPNDNNASYVPAMLGLNCIHVLFCNKPPHWSCHTGTRCGCQDCHALLGVH